MYLLEQSPTSRRILVIANNMKIEPLVKLHEIGALKSGIDVTYIIGSKPKEGKFLFKAKTQLFFKLAIWTLTIGA